MSIHLLRKLNDLHLSKISKQGFRRPYFRYPPSKVHNYMFPAGSHNAKRPQCRSVTLSATRCVNRRAGSCPKQFTRQAKEIATILFFWHETEALGQTEELTTEAISLIKNKRQANNLNQGTILHRTSTHWLVAWATPWNFKFMLGQSLGLHSSAKDTEFNAVYVGYLSDQRLEMKTLSLFSFLSAS